MDKRTTTVFISFLQFFIILTSNPLAACSPGIPDPGFYLQGLLLTDDPNILVSTLTDKFVYGSSHSTKPNREKFVSIDLVEESITEIDENISTHIDILPFSSPLNKHYLINSSQSIYWVIKDSNQSIIFNKTHPFFTNLYLGGYNTTQPFRSLGFFSNYFNMVFLIFFNNIFTSTLELASNVTSYPIEDPLLIFTPDRLYEDVIQTLEINEEFNVIKFWAGNSCDMRIVLQFSPSSLIFVFEEFKIFNLSRIFDQRTNNSLKLGLESVSITNLNSLEKRTIEFDQITLTKILYPELLSTESNNETSSKTIVTTDLIIFSLFNAFLSILLVVLYRRRKIRK
jgi:hypothetical protein